MIEGPRLKHPRSKQGPQSFGRGSRAPWTAISTSITDRTRRTGTGSGLLLTTLSFRRKMLRIRKPCRMSFEVEVQVWTDQEWRIYRVFHARQRGNDTQLHFSGTWNLPAAPQNLSRTNAVHFLKPSHEGLEPQTGDSTSHNRKRKVLT